jgi:hypothetical protein
LNCTEPLNKRKFNVIFRIPNLYFIGDTLKFFKNI